MGRRKKRLSYLVLHQLFIVVILILFLLPFLLVENRAAFQQVLSSQKNSLTPTPTPKQKDILAIPQASADNPTEDYCVTVPALLYHHIQPLYLASENKQEPLTVGLEVFDMHMKYLVDKGYVSLTATQLVKALLNREELPAKSAVVTFDDGYEDNYLYAYPILRKYGIVGNFMVSTALIDTEGYMSWTQLAEMAESNLVSIYNHTSNHTDIGNVTREQALEEIAIAKDTLEKRLGITSPIFAYPYGSVSDTAKEALKFTGYVAAFTTKHGFEQCRSQLLDLHRNHVGNLPLSFYGL